ncbi:hypothetical protein [Parendozoicomonas haliclonae]|uniref:Fumarate reductase subunit C n=1 Tax=Parendozoicomonas haliclonae TaxID=1960125 RepID=A0A1X7ANR6_9GAMM|nr:hypothetical protein [Parendozoicomonas haliclonae]SMA49772.1 Fumarate reductase subunit C [Parendozoicomonas haliclonae]
MSRRPYVRPMPANWFMSKPAYRFYMVREASCVFNLVYGLNLFAGLWQLTNGAEAWAGWLALQAHPLMIVFALATLAMTLLHTVTFVEMAPRVMPQQIRKMIPDNTVKAAMFGGIAVVTAAIIGFTAMGAM